MRNCCRLSYSSFYAKARISPDIIIFSIVYFIDLSKKADDPMSDILNIMIDRNKIQREKIFINL